MHKNIFIFAVALITDAAHICVYTVQYAIYIDLFFNKN